MGKNLEVERFKKKSNNTTHKHKTQTLCEALGAPGQSAASFSCGGQRKKTFDRPPHQRFPIEPRKSKT